MNASTITIIYEFPSEDADIGHFVSKEILWLKYKLCALKSCFSAIRYWFWYGLFNWDIMQSLHNTYIKFDAFGK